MPIKKIIQHKKAIIALCISATIMGCQEEFESRHEIPIPSLVLGKMEKTGTSKDMPVFMRIYKQENVLEIWKKNRQGRFFKFKTYEICKWSGGLGPKFKEGDKQAPEGFYTVAPHQMNPASSYFLSFNLGYPNPFDRAHHRTGSFLMVHGDCLSAGCYAMTDKQIGEIYAIAREAFQGGQSSFQVQAFPFRMTAENLAKHADSQHYQFWMNLKEGADHFEATRQPPKLNYCGKRYVFNSESIDGSPLDPKAECPDLQISPSIRQVVLPKLEEEAYKLQSLQVSTSNRS